MSWRIFIETCMGVMQFFGLLALVGGAALSVAKLLIGLTVLFVRRAC